MTPDCTAGTVCRPVAAAGVDFALPQHHGAVGGNIAVMGKSGNAIKAAVGVVIVSASMDARFEDCGSPPTQ